MKICKVGKVNLYRVCEILSCILLFLPCILSIVSNQIIRSSSILVLYWGVTIVIGILAIQRNGKLSFANKQKIWAIVWLILFCFIILNNNGEIERGVYSNLLNMIMVTVFSCVIVMNRRFDDKHIFIAIMALLFVQLLSGYFFLVFPDKLLSLKSLLVSSDEVWSSKFVSYVEAGCFMGLTAHYSTSGMYMALGTVVSGGALLTDKNKTGKLNKIKLVVFAAFFVALVLTQKRGHLIFGIIAILLMYLVGYVKGNLNKRIKQILGIAIIVVAVFLIAMQIPAFSSTIARFAIESSSLNDVSSNRLDELWIPALEDFKQNPLLGIGWRQFKYLHPLSNGVSNDCHNIYIQLLCETGIIGTCLFLGVMLYTYIITCKALVREKKLVNSDCYFSLMFSFGYQTFFLLYGLTGNPLYDIQCFYPYIISCFLAYKYAKRQGRLPR